MMYLHPKMERWNSWLNISKVEEKYNAKYVGEFPARQHSIIIASLFYQEKPPVEGYSKYFKLHLDIMFDKIMISSGEQISKSTYTGLITPKGNFIYSRGRHDYVTLDRCMIDGGDAYLRTNGKGKIIKFNIREDKLVRRLTDD